MSSRSASTCSWTVTSRAEVGSSAMMRSGSGTIIIAIMTRWPMPPEISCGQASNTYRGSRIRTASSMASARSCASRRDTPACTRKASTICSPTVMTGFSENLGSCRIIEIRLPRSARRSASPARRRSTPSKESCRADMRPLRAKRPSRARPVCDFPDPDSPTIPNFSRPSVKSTSRTATTAPRGVSNVTLSPSTISSGSRQSSTA